MSEDKDIAYYRELEKKEQQEARLKSMGFEPAFADYKFETFEIMPGNKNNFDACKRFALTPFNMYVFGGPGCGKSRLAWSAFYEACTQRGVMGKFINWESFEVGVAQDFDNKTLRWQDRLLDFPFIVLDDILREKPGKLVESALIRFIEKWAARKKKGLIITSNNNLSALSEKIQNDRLPSRLSEAIDLFIENSAPDYRIKDLKQKVVRAGEQLSFEF